MATEKTETEILLNEWKDPIKANARVQKVLDSLDFDSKNPEVNFELQQYAARIKTNLINNKQKYINKHIKMYEEQILFEKDIRL